MSQELATNTLDICEIFLWTFALAWQFWFCSCTSVAHLNMEKWWVTERQLCDSAQKEEAFPFCWERTRYYMAIKHKLTWINTGLCMWCPTELVHGAHIYHARFSQYFIWESRWTHIMCVVTCVHDLWLCWSFQRGTKLWENQIRL